MPIDYTAARILLEDNFPFAEQNLLENRTPPIPPKLEVFFQTIFRSRTQAYREVLLGCTIARMQDRNINIRLPYVNQGEEAFNGRTLDERVVNPFLQEHRIPSSRGPFLSAFRRSVRFETATREGLRDRPGYDALLDLISYVETANEQEELLAFLRYALFKFAQLREEATVPLSRIQRISLEQYGALFTGLIATRSGGRFPLMLVVAAFMAIKEFFHLDWEIEYQGINVADMATGVGADITIRTAGRVLLAAEVTERPVERTRVMATFNTKIAPHGIEDYLFFLSSETLDEATRDQARQYFAQGHEVNFLEIRNWILNCLATMGRNGRTTFNQKMIELLEEPETPRLLKVAWNEQIARVLAV